MDFALLRKIDSANAKHLDKEIIEFFKNASKRDRSGILSRRPDLEEALLAAIGAKKNPSVIAASPTTSQTKAEAKFVSQKTKYYKKYSHNLYVTHIYTYTTQAVLSFCPIHGVKLEKYYFAYRINGVSRALPTMYCKECDAYYSSAENIAINKDFLADAGIPAVYVESHSTWQHIIDNAPVCELDDDCVIYYTREPITHLLVCPLHENETLSIVRCEKTHGEDLRLSFLAYRCAAEGWLLVDAEEATRIRNRCSEIGIPLIRIQGAFHAVRKEVKAGIPVFVTDPVYLVEAGKRISYETTNDIDWNNRPHIGVEDTIVVSDTGTCANYDHIPDDSKLYAAMVVERRSGKVKYALALSYCDECQKYYIHIDDFKAIANYGRLICTLIDETDMIEQISFGEIFRMEEETLKTSERKMQAYIDSIKPPVMPYDTANDYKDISSLQAEKKRYELIYKEMNRVGSFMDKPYFARFDIQSGGGKKQTYYIGKEDVVFGRTQIAYSRWSEIGKLFSRDNIITYNQRGIAVNVKLRRNFEIAGGNLFWYMDRFSDTDSIFRAGITDPFLVKVLRSRKQQHQLTDIIATIQEKQNVIIDAPFSRNILVQGCAGSGKTMVLLHRLTSLKYQHPEIDFGNYCILTPNQNFDAYVSSLVSDLKLTEINRYTVETYYDEMLSTYDQSFRRRDRGTANERNVLPQLVRYAYSDQFIVDLSGAFDAAYLRWQQYVAQLTELSANVGIGMDIPQMSKANSAGMWAAIKKAAYCLNDAIVTEQRAAKKAEDTLRAAQDEYVVAQQRFDDASRQYAVNIAERRQDVIDYCALVIEDNLRELHKAKLELVRLREQLENANSRVFLFNKGSQVAKLEKEITVKEGDISNLEIDISILHIPRHDEKVFDDYSRLIRVVEILKNSYPEWAAVYAILQERYHTLGRAEMLCHEKYNHLIQVNASKPQKIDASIFQRAATLCKEIEEITPASLAQEVVQAVLSVAAEKFAYKLQPYSYRFVLYARLRFARQFFGKPVSQYEFFCIDEGQDISLNEYRLFQDINHKTAILNVYGDSNQLLNTYRGQETWADFTREFKCVQFTLNENYRNTNQIIQYCNDYFGMNVAKTGVDGKSVRRIPVTRLSAEILKYVLENGRIAILIPQTQEKRTFIEQNLGDDIIARLGKGESENHVLAYVEEIKGVEFDIVFAMIKGMQKNEQYIAMTRALTELIIVEPD